MVIGDSPNPREMKIEPNALRLQKLSYITGLIDSFNGAFGLWNKRFLVQFDQAFRVFNLKIKTIHLCFRLILDRFFAVDLVIPT